MFRGNIVYTAKYWQWYTIRETALATQILQPKDCVREILERRAKLDMHAQKREYYMFNKQEIHV